MRLGWIGWRIELEALGQQVTVAGFELGRLRGPESEQALLFGRVNRGFDLPQQFSHRLGPGLLVAFVDKDEAAQVMGIAQGVVQVCILEVGVIIIVDCFILTLR